WLFDRVERLAAHFPDGYLSLMIILPSSAPPDGQTVVESASRLAKLSPSMRRPVIVIVGDSVWQSIGRGVLRVLLPTPRRRPAFPNATKNAMARVVKAPGKHTPSIAELSDDVRALHTELDSAFPLDG